MNLAAADPDLERLRSDIARFTVEQGAAFRGGAPVADLLADRARSFDGWLAERWRSVFSADANERIGLFAVGGYGRGELHPQSDLDILVLVADEPDAALRQRIEDFVSSLWDLNLRPGHAVRTPAQCTEAAADLTVCTALIEARAIVASAELRQRLNEAVAPERIWPVDEFVQAKLDEMVARHARFGDTSYNLEPNLKEGPGGLRDIQTLLWIARRATGSDDPADWAEQGLIHVREWQRLEQARDTLRRLRYGLHLLAGRAEERLLFDYQPAMAELFGMKDRHRENRAVEQLMQGYFRAALAVRRMFARIAARWRERSDADVASESLALGLVRRGRRLALTMADNEPTSTSSRTMREADADEASALAALRDDPALAVRLFACWQRQPDVDELEAASAVALDAFLAEAKTDLSSHPAAREAFLDILRGPGVAGTLSRMHLHGVLGAYLPAFAQVTGRMQYDLFHVYTVDQHTLKVIGNLDRFAAGDLSEFPRANAVFEDLRKQELLYLAALFHDIAKGRGGDHSELGGDDAAAFCRKHGLGTADSDLVEWLVRQHLLLSITAQKSDITDPDVINGFADRVADRERLDALYLLTMADIAGTAPTLWNAWKARLIADLYTAARYALRRGLEHRIHADERVAECRQVALELLANDGIGRDLAESIWEDFPPPSFLRYRPHQIAWVTAQVAAARHEALPLVAVRSEGNRGAHEIFVHSPDIDGLFGAITAALDRLDLAVVEARVITSKKGLSLDTFRVLERSRRDADPGRAEEIVRSLRYALRQRPLRFGPVRRSLTRPQRHFQMAPQIEFAPASVPERTRMALVCSDRPGLLALVAQVLREQAVRVHGARIATFGERAEDFFVLSDERNQPLDNAGIERVRAALTERLQQTFGNGSQDTSTG